MKINNPLQNYHVFLQTAKVCLPSSNPCQNGGSCYEDSFTDSSDFTCTCQQQYTGDMCQYCEYLVYISLLFVHVLDNKFALICWDISIVQVSTHCQLCIPQHGCEYCAFYIKPKLYTAKVTCEQCVQKRYLSVDVCQASNPCSEHATCVSAFDGSLKRCDCNAGYRGDFCDIAEICVNNGPCEHGAQCVEGEAVGEYRCDNCPDGYIGVNCQTSESSPLCILF